MAFDDTLLVKPKTATHPLRWLTLFAMAVVALVGYQLLNIERTSIPSLLYGAQTTSERTSLKYARYILDDQPLLALTGSSLMDRLEEGYLPPHSHNLAGGGDSPLTGLEFLVRQKRLPRIVLVEINVMSRDIDHRLIDEFGTASRAQVKLRYVRPIRSTLVANTLPDAATWWQERAQVLRTIAPASYDHALTSSLLSEMDAAIQRADTRTAFASNARRLAALAALLRSRGTQVLYIELPMSDEVRDHLYNRERRRILGELLAPLQAQSIALPPDTTLRYGDGAHLDERSAYVVARELSALLAPKLLLAASDRPYR